MTVFSFGKQAARVAGKKRELPPRRLSPSAFVARGMMVRALRRANLHHVLCHEPCTIGIAGVAEGSVDAVSSAARDIMGANLTANYGFDVSIYDRTGADPKSKRNLKTLVWEAAKGGERAVFLFSSLDAVPAAFHASAEGTVDFGPVDRRILRGVFMATAKRAPDPAGLDLVASLPLDLLDSVVVKGRSIERTLGVARRLLAAVEAEAETVEPPVPNPATTTVDGPRLEDLSGLGEVGEWGAELVQDLADYRAGTIPWSDVDRGVLVAGPPGVGKTLFAAALGRSCGIPVHVHSCAAWQARGHLGDLLKAMKAAFDEARKAAPCILFLDETDAFGSRTDPGDRYAAYTRQVVDGLLEQLDGAAGREGVVVIGATNHSELIDPALVRPGRLDRLLTVGLPDAGARVGILRYHLRDSLEAADLRPLAERLEGATGAEIELLVRDARRRARRRRDAMALADVEAGLSPEDFQSDALFRRVCVHEAGHLVVGRLLADASGGDPQAARVDRRLRGGSAGSVTFVRRPGFDTTRESLLADITVLLAGLAAEEEILGSRGNGAGAGDLRNATRIAVAIEATLGLGSSILHRAADGDRLDALLDSDRALRRRVGQTLDRCFLRAREAVGSERAAVERVSRELATQGPAAPPGRSREPRQGSMGGECFENGTAERQAPPQGRLRGSVPG